MRVYKKPIRVSYGTSLHGKEEIRSVVKVLQGNTALGKNTENFERAIARVFGKKFGVMVNSGSSANLLAFELLNLPKGSEVVTPILTFATTVAPIIQKQLVPVFVDVGVDSYVIDEQQIESAITKKTKALIVPSLIGSIPNFSRIRSIARKNNLWFIEDSCDTLGGVFHSRPTGAYSDITTTSFYGSHIINGAGGGGMILVNNRVWRQRALLLRGWGRRSSLFGEDSRSEDIRRRFGKKLGNVSYDAKFIFDEVGYNFLPLEVSAAFALEQLKKFKRFFNTREKNFNKLFRFFRKYEKFFILPRQTKNVHTAWLAFPLLIRKEAPFSRKEICVFLEKHNIQTRPVFTGNITKQPAFRHIVGKTSNTYYPAADHIMSHAFLIGCHQGLTSQHIQYIEEVFEYFFRVKRVD